MLGSSQCTWLPAMPTVSCLGLSSLSVSAKNYRATVSSSGLKKCLEDSSPISYKAGQGEIHITQARWKLSYDEAIWLLSLPEHTFEVKVENTFMQGK